MFVLLCLMWDLEWNFFFKVFNLYNIMQCNKECLHIIKHACISSPSQCQGSWVYSYVFMAKIRECKVTRTNRSEKQWFDGEDAKMITKIEKSTFKAVWQRNSTCLKKLSIFGTSLLAKGFRFTWGAKWTENPWLAKMVHHLEHAHVL